MGSLDLVPGWLVPSWMAPEPSGPRDEVRQQRVRTLRRLLKASGQAPALPLPPLPGEDGGGPPADDAGAAAAGALDITQSASNAVPFTAGGGAAPSSLTVALNGGASSVCRAEEVRTVLPWLFAAEGRLDFSAMEHLASQLALSGLQLLDVGRFASAASSSNGHWHSSWGSHVRWAGPTALPSPAVAAAAALRRMEVRRGGALRGLPEMEGKAVSLLPAEVARVVAWRAAQGAAFCDGRSRPMFGEQTVAVLRGAADPAAAERLPQLDCGCRAADSCWTGRAAGCWCASSTAAVASLTLAAAAAATGPALLLACSLALIVPQTLAATPPFMQVVLTFNPQHRQLAAETLAIYLHAYLGLSGREAVEVRPWTRAAALHCSMAWLLPPPVQRAPPGHAHLGPACAGAAQGSLPCLGSVARAHGILQAELAACSTHPRLPLLRRLLARPWAPPHWSARCGDHWRSWPPWPTAGSDVSRSPGLMPAGTSRWWATQVRMLGPTREGVGAADRSCVRPDAACPGWHRPAARRLGPHFTVRPPRC